MWFPNGDGTVDRDDVIDDEFVAVDKGEKDISMKTERSTANEVDSSTTTKSTDQTSFLGGDSDDPDAEDVENVNTYKDALTVVVHHEPVMPTNMPPSYYERQQPASPNVTAMQLLQWPCSAMYPVNQCQGVMPVLAHSPQMVSQEVAPPDNLVHCIPQPQHLYGGRKVGFGQVPYFNNMVNPAAAPNYKQYMPRNSCMEYAAHGDYPVRPDVVDCQSYIQTGMCQYGFNRPERWISTNDKNGGEPVNSDGTEVNTSEPESKHQYPQRPGEPECKYYMRTGTCRYGLKCFFHHPHERTSVESIQLQYEEEKEDRMPCEHFMRTGTCAYGKQCCFRHSSSSPTEVISSHDTNESNSSSTSDLPQRPDMPSCHFYLRTGKCAFGKRCKWNHPIRFARYVVESQAAVSNLSSPVLPLIPFVHGFPNLKIQYPSSSPMSPISPISPMPQNIIHVQSGPHKGNELIDAHQEYFAA